MPLLDATMLMIHWLSGMLARMFGNRAAAMLVYRSQRATHPNMYPPPHPFTRAGHHLRVPQNERAVQCF